MNVLQILRFFLPGENPLGFGLADAIEFFIAITGFAAFVFRRRIIAGAEWLAERPRAAMAVLFVLPGALRLLLLRHHPVPIPTTPDDFSFLLQADTFAHFRLANPVHPMHRFFEALFVLQEPSRSSIYPPGQGILLALFGHPWIGVLVGAGLFAASCFRMLREYVPPAWALCGGLLTVATMGPLSQWMNTYFGGYLSAIAGCLVFGPRTPWSVGLGLGLQLITRPFEFLLLAPVAAWRGPRRAQVLIPVAAAGLLMLLHNHAVTGKWTTLPYMESRAQYGVPATFTFEANPQPQRALRPEQQMAYEVEVASHDHPLTWTERLSAARFFLLPALFAALPFAWRRGWAFGVIALFFLGTAFYPYFFPHYIAAVACLFVLLAVTGLSRMHPAAATVLLIFSGAHVLFWYGLHLTGNPAIFSATSDYEGSDYINYGDAEGRIRLASQLALEPGRHLVLVRYSAAHTVREWVGNGADIDGSRVVTALDLGEEENRALLGYYKDRKAWLLEPDVRPLRLTPVLR